MAGATKLLVSAPALEFCCPSIVARPRDSRRWQTTEGESGKRPQPRASAAVAAEAGLTMKPVTMFFALASSLSVLFPKLGLSRICFGGKVNSMK